MANTSPGEHFQAGDLAAAIEAATAQAKLKPTDPGPRSMLGQLLLAAGELERADKMFDAVSNLHPESAMWASVQRGLIRGELARREVFHKGRPPKLMADPSDAIAARLEALLLLRDGDESAAANKLAEANEVSASITASAGGEATSPFRDMDDVLGPTLEILTASGEYYWIAPESLESIAFSPVQNVADVLYRPAVMLSADGQEGAVYMPSVYLDSEESACRTAGTTKWVGETVVRGRGQREFQIGPNAYAVLELETLRFEPSVEA